VTQTADQTLTGPIDHMVFVHIDQDLVLANGRSQGVGITEIRSQQLIRVVAGGIPATALATLPGRPHGDHLLVGGPNGQVRVVDPGTGHEQPPINAGAGEVRDLAVGTDADGQEIVVIARDSGLSVWATAGTELRPITEDVSELPARPFRVCLYRQGGRPFVACALTDGSIVTWDLTDPQAPPVVMVRRHSGPIWTIITIPGPDAGNDLVASGGSDQFLRVWEPAAAGQLRQHRAYLTGGTIRRLGHVIESGVALLVTASARGPVSLWRYDGPAERPVAEITLHRGEVYSVACETLPDAIVVASGDFNGDFLINRLTSNVLLDQHRRQVARIAGTIWGVTAGIAEFGEFYACAGVNRTVYIVDPVAQNVRHAMTGHDSTVRALAVVGDANACHVISGGADHTVVDWDPVTGIRRAVLEMGHLAEVWAVAGARHKGRTYAVSGGPDGTVRACDVDVPGDSEVLVQGIGEVSSLAVARLGDETYVLAGSTQGLYRIPLLGGEAHEVTKDAVTAIATLPGLPKMAVIARPNGTVELYDPIAGVLLKRFAMPLSNRQVRALAMHRTTLGDVLVFGGCDNGDVLKWDGDGRLIGTESKGGDTSIRSLAVTGGGGVGGTAGLLGGGHDGVLRHWPISDDRPLSSGGSLDGPVRPVSILLQDQPADADLLARTALTNTLVAALTSPETVPPVVVGVHAPWGQGKSSVLRQLRAEIDPTVRDEDAPPEVVETHRLVTRDGSRLVTDVTPTWAWRRLQERAGETELPYTMVPAAGQPAAITAWFNPWMYEERSQIWAGLTNEILTAITRRLPQEERHRLYIDLNLKRSDAGSLRKQILDSYRPHSLRGLVFVAAGALALVAAVVAFMVALVNTNDFSKIIPGAAVIFFVAFGVIVRFVASGMKGFKVWYNPSAASGPRMGGVGATDASRDPLEAPERGYLYLLRHDVREVIGLAKGSPLYIFIDDMDRCSPAIVADTIEAINLFLTKAFGPCIFVMGLDPATVAAHLESHLPAIAQRAQEDPVTYRQLRHMGWRFMEKIVDLPVRLPRVTDTAMTNYLNQLLLTNRQGGSGPISPPTPDGQVVVAAGTATPLGAPGALVASDPPPAGSPSGARSGSRTTRRSRADRRAGSVRVPEQRSEPDPGPEPAALPDQRIEDIPVVRDALNEAVQNLPGRNPRQVKAFVNIWRFYMGLEDQLGVTTSSLTGTQVHSAEMARLVEIMVRWPWLLDPLGARRTHDGRQTNLLDVLCSSARDNRDWTQSMEREGMNPDDEDTRGLRELLVRHGTDADELVSISQRYL
jgi:WD40 repeat protein